MKRILYAIAFSIILLVALYRTFQYYKDLKQKHGQYQEAHIVGRRSKCLIATIYSWIVIIPSCIGVGIAVVLNTLETFDHVFGTHIVQLSQEQCFGVYFSALGIYNFFNRVVVNRSFWRVKWKIRINLIGRLSKKHLGGLGFSLFYVYYFLL